MTLAALLSIFGGSFLGALVPIVNVELIVAVAAHQMGDGIVPAATVALIGAAGTMAGKLQVYLVARGGRTLGGRWIRRRSERQARQALVTAHRHDAQETPEWREDPAAISPTRRVWLRVRHILAGPSVERLAAPAVLLSGLLGIPPLAIVTAVAGASRMRWQVFMGAGLLGRVVRFFVVYEVAAFALKQG
jgi:membrane protein YqaA with SNARE-associated domain